MLAQTSSPVGLGSAVDDVGQQAKIGAAPGADRLDARGDACDFPVLV
jgi:hypothetical protein